MIQVFMDYEILPRNQGPEAQVIELVVLFPLNRISL
jgi:hypothetical protein